MTILYQTLVLALSLTKIMNIENPSHLKIRKTRIKCLNDYRILGTFILSVLGLVAVAVPLSVPMLRVLVIVEINQSFDFVLSFDNNNNKPS